MSVTDGMTPRQQQLYADLQAAMGADADAADPLSPTIQPRVDGLGSGFEMVQPPAGEPPEASATGGEGGTAATASPQPSPGEPDMRSVIARHTGGDTPDDEDEDEEGLVIIDEDEVDDEEIDNDAAPAGPTPDGTEVATGPDLGAVWESHYGRRPTVDEVVDFLGYVDAVNQATPQQRYLIAQVLQGYDPVAAAPPPASQPSHAQATGAPAATSSPSEPPLIPVDPYADDSTRAAIEAVNASIRAQHERMATWEAQQQAQQMAQQQATIEARNDLIMAAVKRARDSFYNDHPGFTPEQQVEIEKAVRVDGRFAPMLNIDPNTYLPRNDPEEVAKRVYAMVVDEQPALRAVRDNARIASQEEQATKDAKRKRKATSVSGRSAAIPAHRATGGREKGMEGLREALEEVFAGNEPAD